jgi:hypothetical protein
MYYTYVNNTQTTNEPRVFGLRLAFRWGKE